MLNSISKFFCGNGFREFFDNLYYKGFMILRVFSIYDSKVEAYLQPMFLRTANEAIRAITSYVNQPDHHFSKNAADLTLFELGVWDDSNAKFVLHDAKVNLGNLVEFKANYAQG